MRIAALSAAVAVAFSGAAQASGPARATADPVVSVPAAAPADQGYAWGGFYGGATYGSASGRMFDVAGPFFLNNDSHLGALVLGYRRDLGRTVLGAELSSTVAVDLFQFGFPAWYFERMTDLRVTAGREVGRALVYVSGGYANAGFVDGGGLHHVYDGWSLGVGVDYRVTDRVALGVEYIHRDISRTDLRTWNGVVNAVQMRATVRF